MELSNFIDLTLEDDEDQPWIDLNAEEDDYENTSPCKQQKRHKIVVEDESEDLVNQVLNDLHIVENQPQQEIQNLQTVNNNSSSSNNNESLNAENQESISKLLEEVHSGWTKNLNETVRNHLTRYFLQVKRYPYSVAKNIHDNSRIILHKLGPPFQNRSKSALVFGQVQSGKTTSMQSLVALALDAGFKFIIVISGRTVILRDQTHKRFKKVLRDEDDEESDEEESEDSEINFAPLKDVKINWLTTNDEDISGRNNEKRIESLDGVSPVVAIIKKNANSLNWISVLLGEGVPITQKQNRNIGQCSSYLNFPALIIDDECDEGSPNYKPPEAEPTKIYSLLSNIRGLFKVCHYVGYTATPVPNLMINAQDTLFPDILWSLDVNGKGYVGLDIHSNPELENRIVVKVPYSDYPNYSPAPENIILPSNVKRGIRNIQLEFMGDILDNDNETPPHSILQALCDFVFTGAIRKWRTQLIAESEACSITSLPTISAITNLGGMQLGEFWKELEQPVNNLYKVALSIVQNEDALNEGIEAAIERMLDSCSIELSNLKIGYQQMKKMQNYLKDLSFQDEKFRTSNISNDNWIQALAQSCNAQFILLQIEPTRDSTQIELNTICTYGTGDANHKVYLVVKNYRSAPTYHQLRNTSIIRQLEIPSEPQSPFYSMEFYSPTLRKGKKVPAKKAKTVWHSILFHFSQYHENNKMVYELVEQAWALVKREIKQSLAPRPNIRSKRVHKAMEDSWKRLESNMRYFKEHVDNSLPIPESRKQISSFLDYVCSHAEQRLVICARKLDKKYKLLRKLDYATEDEQDRVPEFLICVGGTILGRGVTLEGLTTSYYVRCTSKDNWDTALQHCRWFGWRNGYQDLITLYTQERQLQLYRDIAVADSQLRKQFNTFAAQGLDPRDYKLIIERHQSYQLTAPSKSRNMRELRVTKYVIPSYPIFRNPDAQKVLDLTTSFVLELEQNNSIEKITRTNPGAIVFYQVSRGQVLQFLRDIPKKDSRYGDLILRIEKMDASIGINIALRKTKNPPTSQNQIVSKYGLIRRASNAQHPERINMILGRENVDNSLTYDEFLDAKLSNHDREVHHSCRHWFQIDDEEQIENRVKGGPLLLIIYLLDPKCKPRDANARDDYLEGDCPMVIVCGCFPEGTELIPIPIHNSTVPKFYAENTRM